MKCERTIKSPSLEFLNENVGHIIWQEKEMIKMRQEKYDGKKSKMIYKYRLSNILGDWYLWIKQKLNFKVWFQ